MLCVFTISKLTSWCGTVAGQSKIKQVYVTNHIVIISFCTIVMDVSSCELLVLQVCFHKENIKQYTLLTLKCAIMHSYENKRNSVTV